ncbi:MAG: pilus assembly protein, partial [Nitrososphaerales archaeon]
PTVYADCQNIATAGQVSIDPSATLATAQYMQVSDSSDDPSINDVLYAPTGWAAPVCMVYGGPNPPNPWPYNSATNPFGIYSLADYNSNPGGVQVDYTAETNGCARETGPTNAGYVPYAMQTMYIARGFGYDATGQLAAPPAAAGYWAPLVTITEGSAGQNPTTASVNTALSYFTPFLAPETNSTGTTEIKAVAEQSPLAGLLSNALGYFTKVNPTSSNGCSTQRYVILLTDGMPTKDLAGHSWPPPGSTAATNYGVTVNFNGDGSLNTTSTNDQALLDTISTLTTMDNGTNKVKTYVIALGAGVQGSTASNVLNAMAIAGGTSQAYYATDPVTLSQDLNTI